MNFKSKLEEIDLSQELKNKLINQFQEFDVQCQFMRPLPFKYVIDTLIELNEKYENFTESPVEMYKLENPSRFDCVFYNTCVDIGWIIFLKDNINGER